MMYAVWIHHTPWITVDRGRARAAAKLVGIRASNTTATTVRKICDARGGLVDHLFPVETAGDQSADAGAGPRQTKSPLRAKPGLPPPG